MAFSVEAFKTSLNRDGVAYRAHGEMTIIPPASAPRLADLARELTIRIEASEMPGRGIQTLENRYWGPARKIGYNSTHPDVTLTVLCSNDLRERDLFLGWQDLAAGSYRLDNGFSAPTFNAGYYDDYVGTATVTQYDDQQNSKVYDVTLLEAYPTHVSPLSYTWNAQDLQKITVTLTYRYYVDSLAAVGPVSLPSLPSLPS